MRCAICGRTTTEGSEVPVDFKPESDGKGHTFLVASRTEWHCDDCQDKAKDRDDLDYVNELDDPDSL